jgi:hypothetical protein
VRSRTSSPSTSRPATITHPNGLRIELELDPFERETLVHGLDDVRAHTPARGRDRGVRGRARRPRRDDGAPRIVSRGGGSATRASSQAVA